MTTFTGPLKVKLLDAETTVAEIEVSGTAMFAAMTVVGALTVSGGLNVTGTAQVTQGGQTGKMELIQQVTIAQDNTAAAPAQLVLPSAANITDVLIDIETPFASPAGATACNVDVQLASAANLIGRAVVSASGRYDALTLGGVGNKALLRDLNADTTVQAFVSIQASNTAINAGQGILTVKYVV